MPLLLLPAGGQAELGAVVPHTGGGTEAPGGIGRSGHCSLNWPPAPAASTSVTACRSVLCLPVSLPASWCWRLHTAAAAAAAGAAACSSTFGSQQYCPLFARFCDVEMWFLLPYSQALPLTSLAPEAAALQQSWSSMPLQKSANVCPLTGLSGGGSRNAGSSEPGIWPTSSCMPDNPLCIRRPQQHRHPPGAAGARHRAR